MKYSANFSSKDNILSGISALMANSEKLFSPKNFFSLFLFLLLSLFLLSRSYSYDLSFSSAATAATLGPRFLLSSGAFSSVNATERTGERGRSSSKSLESESIRDIWTFSSVNATTGDRGRSLSHSSESEMIRDLASCDIFDGAWVLDDDAEPIYRPGSCPYVDDAFNCFKNRRPDSSYLKYRWMPHGCHIPRFDGLKMLRLLKGKRVVFVGDSLNRNMWESLGCALRASVKDKTKISEVSGLKEFRTEGFRSLRFRDYGCSIDFVKSPFLVQEWKSSPYKETLRLDMMQASKPQYHDADIIIFNTGHWWNHHKTGNGINYFQEGRHVYDKLEVTEALSKALKTWAKWVDSRVDSMRTRVVFNGFSASHYRGQWNSGGKCDGETEPIRNESYLGEYPWSMRILEDVIEEMKTPVLYLNVTKMTDFRKDGHPSVYRG